MTRECQKKPELHQPTLNLISTIYHGHQAGSCRINLADTVKLFGNLNADDEARLRQRGDLVFTRKTASGGTFENKGNVVSTSQHGITVTVPPDVKGTYTSFPDSFQMNFDVTYSITGRFLFFSVRIEDFRADQNRIDVDLSGDAFDQCIIHNPAA